MGNLLVIMLDDKFDQCQLFHNGFIRSGCSIVELARLACTSRLGLAWTRRHLALGGQDAIKALLFTMPNTLGCNPDRHLGRPVGSQATDFDRRGGPIAWTNLLSTPGRDFTQLGICLHEITSFLSCFEFLKVRVLFRKYDDDMDIYGSITRQHCHAFFRTFDDIVRAAFPREPPLRIDGVDEIEQLKKKQRY
jgi:hypothetical protein